MTIESAIDRLDALVYNRLGVEEKVAWLSELDGIIYREILSTHLETAGKGFPGYHGGTPMSKALLVPAPYDRLYIPYLEMRLFDVLGEITRYNNAAQQYNTALLAYADQVNRACTPLGQRCLRLV